MKKETESPFRVVHFPEKLQQEDILCRSILQLGPVLNARVELHAYVEDTLKQMVKKMKGVRGHVPLDQLIVAYNPMYKSGQSEREYNLWISNQIKYHTTPDIGRVTLLTIPKSRGRVQDTLRGYAKHTGFELGLIAASYKFNKSNIVVCIEKGAPEEIYYRDSLEDFCPELIIHTSIDDAIEQALSIATFDEFVQTSKVDYGALTAQST
jgi:hypothetical protein